MKHNRRLAQQNGGPTAGPHGQLGRGGEGPLRPHTPATCLGTSHYSTVRDASRLWPVGGTFGPLTGWTDPGAVSILGSVWQEALQAIVAGTAPGPCNRAFNMTSMLVAPQTSALCLLQQQGGRKEKMKAAFCMPYTWPPGCHPSAF